jgi:hypothetical protein
LYCDNIPEISKSFWTDRPNRRKYFDQLGNQLGINQLEDWYNARRSDLKQLGGAQLLQEHYRDSLFNALKDVYPDYPWKIWKFLDTTVPKGYWEKISNQKECLESIGHILGVRTLEDWYRVSTSAIQKLGGGGMLSYYDYSLQQGIDIIILIHRKALRAIYPHYNWIPSKFNSVPRNHWSSIANQRQYFDNLAKELGIFQPEDWYHVTKDVVARRNGSGLLRLYGDSLIKALTTVYPEYNLKLWKFAQPHQEYGDYSSMTSEQYTKSLTDKITSKVPQ